MIKRLFKVIFCSFTIIIFLKCTSTIDAQEAPYEPATKINILVLPFVNFMPPEYFKYAYKLIIKPDSIQKVEDFNVEVDFTVGKLLAPPRWVCMFFEKIPKIETKYPPPNSVVSWGAKVLAYGEAVLISPGSTMEGFSFESRGLPGVVTFFSRGYVPIPKYSYGAAPPDNRPKYWDDCVKGKTIGPTPLPSEPLNLISFIGHIISLKEEAFNLKWIDNEGIANSLNKKLENAKMKIEQSQQAPTPEAARNNLNAARNILNAFINELDAQKGKHIDDNAYYLLKVNVEYLLYKMK